MASDKVVYEEIGIVVASPTTYPANRLTAGDKVYFDSWMAAKFPKEGSVDEFYWLVPFENIKAYESSLPEVDVQGWTSSQVSHTQSNGTGLIGALREMRNEDAVSEQHAEPQVHGVPHSPSITTK